MRSGSHLLLSIASYTGDCCVATRVPVSAEHSRDSLVLHAMDTLSTTATYEIVRHSEGWAVRHRDELTGPYETKQAAFEAAASFVELLIADGQGVEIRVPPEGPAQGR